jgi:DNA-directed RNA polymerase sigma subunit (sigma70/sigma32)
MVNNKKPLRIKKGGFDGLTSVVLYSSTLNPVKEDEISAIKEAFIKLSDRQKEVLELRFGLGNEMNPIALEAIGNKWGITRERVRQLQERALKRLRIMLDNAPKNDFIQAEVSQDAIL